MHSKILHYLLTPAVEFFELYTVSIDGVEYVAVENLAELLSGLIYLLVDVFNQVEYIALFEVVSCALLLGVVIFLSKAIYYRRKEKKTADL